MLHVQYCYLLIAVTVASVEGLTLTRGFNSISDRVWSDVSPGRRRPRPERGYFVRDPDVPSRLLHSVSLIDDSSSYPFGYVSSRSLIIFLWSVLCFIAFFILSDMDDAEESGLKANAGAGIYVGCGALLIIPIVLLCFMTRPEWRRFVKSGFIHLRLLLMFRFDSNGRTTEGGGNPHGARILNEPARGEPFVPPLHVIELIERGHTPSGTPLSFQSGFRDGDKESADGKAIGCAPSGEHQVVGVTLWGNLNLADPFCHCSVPHDKVDEKIEREQENNPANSPDSELGVRDVTIDIRPEMESVSSDSVKDDANGLALIPIDDGMSRPREYFISRSSQPDSSHEDYTMGSSWC